MNKNVNLIILIGLLFFINSCSSSEYNAPEMDSSSTNQKKIIESDTPRNKTQKPLITFVELGSVKCIPCKMMQPVMRSIEKKYANQIEVVFHDVWKPEERHYAQEYGIRVIPTQVFLNKNGEEIFRHEGFFPEKEIDEFLQAAGLKILNP
jgi:thioredoxin 1